MKTLRAVLGMVVVAVCLGPGMGRCGEPPAEEASLTVWLMCNLPARKQACLWAAEAAAQRQAAKEALHDLHDELESGKLPRVKVLNLDWESEVSLLANCPVVGLPLAEQMLGQLPLLRSLNEHGERHHVAIKVRFLQWDTALPELLSTESASPDAPDVIQLGSTWYADFEALGKLAPIPAEWLAKWQGNASPNTSRRRCAAPWFVDIRLLYYWRVDSQGNQLPAADLPVYLADWKAVAQVVRRYPVAQSPSGLPSYPLVVYNGRSLERLHLYLMLVRGVDVFREAPPNDVPLLFAELARENRVYFPTESALVAKQGFRDHQYNMIIELPCFAAELARDLAPEGKAAEETLWRDSIGAAALPQTFRGGSYLALFARQNQSASQRTAALQLIKLLLAAPDASGMLPVDQDARAGWLSTRPPRLQEALRAALDHSAEHPSSPYWARAVERAAMLDDLNHFWGTVAKGGYGESPDARRKSVKDETAKIATSIRDRVAAFRRERLITISKWVLAAFAAAAICGVAVSYIRRERSRSAAEAEKERSQLRLQLLVALLNERPHALSRMLVKPLEKLYNKFKNKQCSPSDLAEEVMALAKAQDTYAGTHARMVKSVALEVAGQGRKKTANEVAEEAFAHAKNRYFLYAGVQPDVECRCSEESNTCQLATTPTVLSFVLAEWFFNSLKEMPLPAAGAGPRGYFLVEVQTDQGAARICVVTPAAIAPLHRERLVAPLAEEAQPGPVTARKGISIIRQLLAAGYGTLPACSWVADLAHPNDEVAYAVDKATRLAITIPTTIGNP